MIYSIHAPGSKFGSAVAELAEDARTSARRVLVVDDDASVRGSLAAVLDSEGFVVEEAGDGVEALAKAAQHSPDLVLLDLNMPQMDGWAAFRQLDRLKPLVPVIVITARPHQYEEAVRQGVDAFMEKPLNIPLLLCAVKRLSQEDPKARERRVSNRAFVTNLLGEIFPQS